MFLVKIKQFITTYNNQLNLLLNPIYYRSPLYMRS